MLKQVLVMRCAFTSICKMSIVLVRIKVVKQKKNGGHLKPGSTVSIVNRNYLGQFREIPWNKTTDVHWGSTLITRVTTRRWRYITWRWRHRNHVSTITSVIAAKQIVGEPEIQKLDKSGRKVAEFWTIYSVSVVFQKCENRYCTNFKSCKRCLFVG